MFTFLIMGFSIYFFFMRLLLRRLRAALAQIRTAVGRYFQHVTKW